jgi:hypothetical protein
MKEQTKEEIMEWFMTYSWGILASIIAIGVLFYFGIFYYPKPAVKNCFNITAMRYCNNQEMYLISSNHQDFVCEGLNDSLYRTEGTYRETFFFLPKEVKLCSNV